MNRGCCCVRDGVFRVVVACGTGCSRTLYRSSYGIIECIVVLLVVIVRVHQTEVLKRQRDVLTSLRQLRLAALTAGSMSIGWIVLVIRILLLMDVEDL